MDSFMESLNRLKAVHEQEVLGLQNKLLELNSERCRDAQRAEELCAKNHQLREQQKALKDNVRVLENRLRAGLCDRCTVTQELARKRQQEFESSLLQNLQHIFILTNEMTRLQEENESLKEEVTRLQGLGPKPPCREGAPDATSPPTRTSPGARKATAEKLPGEEAEDHPPEKLAYQMSPGAKVSPRASPAEPRAPDVSPQRIANQLHTTIAVVRPGSRACSADRSPASGTPPALSSPPSPPHKHGLPLDSFPRASRPSAVTCESLKHSLQADRLCLLNRRLALHLRNPHSSPRGPATAPGGLPNQGLKAGEAEAWEKTSGLLGLSGTLVDMRDPRLEGALSLLLARQADGARLRGPHRPGETLPSPPVGSDSEGPEGEVARATLPGKRHPRPTGTGSPRAKEVRTTQDDVPDKPLDLSEWGRGRDAPTSTGRPGPPSPRAAHAPSPEPPQGVEPPAQSGPWQCSNGTKGTRAPEPEEPRTPEPLPGPQPSLLSPGADESRERPKPSPHPQRPDTEGHLELSKPEAQPQVSDGPDTPDTPDASDNEGGLSPEEASPSTPGEAPRCFCTTEPRQGRPPKRKQTPSSDQWEKASKKLS